LAPDKPRFFWPYAILLAEVLAFYRKVLFRPGKFVIPWDLRYYHLPLAESVARSFRQGHLPLWDPFTYCGWPVYAELTAQAFYPPTMIATLLSNALGGRHLLYFMELQLIAHVFLGGIFAYLLLRRLGTGAAAALIGASVYQLGPFFASQTQHLCAIDAAAWLPLSWLAVVALAEQFTWRWVAALALSLALSILSGFPAVTVVAFVSCFLLGAVLRSWRYLPAFAIACVWAVALAAIQILPTVELNGLSVGKYRSDWLGDGGGHPLQSLISIVIPNYWGIFQFGEQPYRLPWNPTFLYLYFGLLALAFILAALIGRRDRYTAPLAILTVVCLVWMLGEHTPVWRTIFRLLPNAVKLPIYAEYALPAFALGMAALAGLGAQRLLSRRRGVIPAAAVAACALELIAVSSGRPMNTGSFDNEPGIAYSHFEGFQETPAKMRALANQFVPPARIDTMNGSIQWANTASMLEVPDAEGNDPLAPDRLMQIRKLFCQGDRSVRYCEISAPDSPIIDLLNVRYVISSAPLERVRFRKIAELPGNFIYENPQAQPRFFLVSRIRPVAGMAEALTVMRSPDFNSRLEAVVEQASACSNKGKLAPTSSQLTVKRYEPLSVELEVESAADAYLVTSETNYPGWRAYLDGRPQSLFMTNVAFRGLPVPAGRHTIRMQFRPTILLQGAIISLLSWTALAALLLWNWISRRKSKLPLT
jgi:Bacterial membrane protein YfhO